jgi:hypothetical protein
MSNPFESTGCDASNRCYGTKISFSLTNVEVSSLAADAKAQVCCCNVQRDSVRYECRPADATRPISFLLFS